MSPRAPREPVDTLTCSYHWSEGVTLKSLAEACFVHWCTSWPSLCQCKSEETPADILVTPHQHQCWRNPVTPKSCTSSPGRPSRSSRERACEQQGSGVLLFAWPAAGTSPLVWNRSFLQCSGVETPLFSDWFIIISIYTRRYFVWI